MRSRYAIKQMVDCMIVGYQTGVDMVKMVQKGPLYG